MESSCLGRGEGVLEKQYCLFAVDLALLGLSFNTEVPLSPVTVRVASYSVNGHLKPFAVRRCLCILKGRAGDIIRCAGAIQAFIQAHRKVRWFGVSTVHHI